MPLSINPSYHIVSPFSMESALISTLGTRDFSRTVSGFGKVSLLVASALGRRSVGLWVTSKHPDECDKKSAGSQGIS